MTQPLTSQQDDLTICINLPSSSRTAAQQTGTSNYKSPKHTYLFSSSKQGSHTRTSFSMPNFGMVEYLDEHLPQKICPQARQWCCGKAMSTDRGHTHTHTATDCWKTIKDLCGPVFPAARPTFRVITPNWTLHRWHSSASTQSGAWTKQTHVDCLVIV